MDDLSAVSNANLSSQISVLVAKKAMDAEKEQAMALVGLIRQAVPPEPGSGADGKLDVYA